MYSEWIFSDIHTYSVLVKMLCSVTQMCWICSNYFNNFLLLLHRLNSSSQSWLDVSWPLDCPVCSRIYSCIYYFHSLKFIKKMKIYIITYYCWMQKIFFSNDICWVNKTVMFMCTQHDTKTLALMLCLPVTEQHTAVQWGLYLCLAGMNKALR